MTSNNTFWQSFNDKDFDAALADLLTQEKDQQLDILRGLFQAASNQKEPFFWMVHRAKLDEGKNFEDFYKAWLPPEDACNPIEYCGEKYLQHFKMPVRVINTVNMKDENEIISITLLWAESVEEQQQALAELNESTKGMDSVNERRHNSIKDVCKRELLGVFTAKSDDNLGTPF